MSDILAIEGELLPCPFCGGEASIFTSAIECDSCHCKMSLYDDDGRRKLKDGIARWNRRDAEIDPELLTAAWLHGADYARRKARWPDADTLARWLQDAWNDETVSRAWFDIAKAVLARAAAFTAPRWPEPTDEAAEQLARAIHDQREAESLGVTIRWSEISATRRANYTWTAAAVLRRLREQEGEDAAE